MPAKAGIDSNFEDFLLRVEDAVSNYVDKLICGDISPDPHFDDSCKYCPYLFCEKRR
jgi:hypothetical protein